MKRYRCISVTARGIFCLLLTFLLIKTADVPIQTAAQGRPLPILMYHGILKDPARGGDYVISPQLLESDLAFLKSRGYTSLLPSELYEAVTKGEDLPPKPVMITFDDGFLNNLTYGLPLLEKYDMKATVAVVGSYSERFSDTPDPNPAYAHLSWDDITELTQSGRVEIANHSYDMHKKEGRKGTRRKFGEDEADYYAALVQDVGKTQSLLEQHCGIVPTAFAYPYGSISRESVAVLQEMGFNVLFTCSEKVNMINGEVDQLLSLGRFNRPKGISTERFMKRLGIN
ncbi:MAG: polysaccharide deacetylase family protein [Oscillospiraceae bacterium]|nr:polysaccharide deacetylase family protein [Oscillospiraceae bacterium]